MRDVKLCIECKHHQIRDIRYLCKRNEDGTIDVVTGFKPLYKAPTCYSERSKPWFFRKDRCGPEGKYFEPRPKPSKPPPPPSKLRYESKG